MTALPLPLFPLAGRAPSESQHTRAVFPVSSALTGGSWSAMLSSINGNCANFTLASPPTAAIGRYKLSLQMMCGNQAYARFLGQFVLLFNPWCQGKMLLLPACRPGMGLCPTGVFLLRVARQTMQLVPHDSLPHHSFPSKQAGNHRLREL